MGGLYREVVSLSIQCILPILITYVVGHSVLVIETWSFIHYSVKRVYGDHPARTFNLAFIERWSLFSLYKFHAKRFPVCVC